LFDYLNDLMKKQGWGVFERDVAASHENTLCEEYYTEKLCGLSHPWAHVNFCNPPFKQAGKWVVKACEEAHVNGVTTLMILPVIGSQSWAHEYLFRRNSGYFYGVYLLYPDVRISFDEPDGSPSRSVADRDVVFALFRKSSIHPSFGVRPLRIRESALYAERKK
jgi:hypothetical protein